MVVVARWFISEWVTPVPADMTWISPGSMTV